MAQRLLPTPPMPPLVGRDRDLAAVRALLEGGARLVTVLGPAGVGKSRLTEEVAPEETRFVRLAGARSLDDVLAQVGGALGIAATTGRHALAERVVRAMASWDGRLLVLDDFEHLAPLAHATVGRWLAAPRGPRILVTSRAHLRLDAEHVHELVPLAVDADGPGEPDAVRLLRAAIGRAGGPSGAGSEDGAELAQIARALDGIPLALELAAQRIAVFGAPEVRARLGSVLDFLTDTRLDARPAHRSLRDTIAWSFDLLERAEQVALAQASVFRGTFDLAAATEVLDVAPHADVVEILQRLREQSLLAATADAQPRFRLLAPIRCFAREQLSPDDRARALDRHAACYLARAEGDSAGDLERDREQLFAVLDRATRRPGPELPRAILAIAPLALARGPVQPILDALELAAAAGVSGDGGALEVLHARLLRRTGRAAEATGRFERALAARIAPEPYLRAELAYSKFSAGRVAEAIDDWGLARAARRLGPDDPIGEGADLVRTAFALRELGEDERAEALASEALVHARRRGDAGAQATALAILAAVASDRDDAGRALTLAREAVTQARTTSSLFLIGIATSALAMAHLARAEHTEADLVLRPCQALLARVGLVRLDAGALTYLGLLAWERGDLGRARDWLEDAAVIYRAIGDTRYGAHATAALAAIDADDDLLAAAALRVAELPASDGLPLSRAVELHLVHLELAAARREEQHGRPGAATALRQAAGARLTDEPRSLEWRFARRLARNVFQHGTEVLEILDGGARCRLGGLVVELGRHASAREIVGTLIRARLDRPGQPLTWSELCNAGWPDQRLVPASAKNRLKVAIAWLRKAGLRGVLASDLRGYWLRPSVRVTVNDLSVH